MPLRTVDDLINLANQSPIWKIRISDQEFSDLRVHLQTARAPQRDKVLVLVAAEAFRRTYAGGAWSWDVVSACLGHGGWNHQNLRASAETGLLALGRTIRRGHHGAQLVMSTVIVEAGLATWLLQQEGRSALNWCRTVLEDLETFGIDGTHTSHALDAERLAARRSPSNAGWQRDSGVHQLVGLLSLEIRKLHRCVGTLPTRETLDLLDWLAKQAPGWADALPLDISHHDSANMVAALLGEAEVVATRGREPRVVTTLDGTSGRFELRRTIELRGTLSDAQLDDLFGGHANQRPHRLTLLASSAAGTVRAAILRRTDQGWTVYADEGEFRGNVAVRLELHGATAVPSVASGLANGSPLPDDLPWVFAEKDAVWTLIALGQVRHRASKLRVALPHGAAMDGDATRLGQVTGRDLYEINAPCTIRQCNDECVITPSSAVEDDLGTLVARGRLHRWSPDDRDLFVGCPRFTWHTEAGVALKVESQELRTRLAGPNAAWRPGPPQEPGNVTVRWVRGASTMGEVRFSWLTDGSDIELNQITDKGGLLRPTGCLQRLGVRVGQPGVAAQQQADGLSLTAHGVPPARLDIDAILTNNANVRLRVPFPIRRAVFFERAGATLDAAASIGLQRLAGSRVDVHAPEAGAAHLSVVLHNARGQPTQHCTTVRIPGKAPLFTLDLAAIRSHVSRLFALDASLDAFVELRPDTSPSPMTPSPAIIRVKRYERRLVRVENTDTLTLDPPFRTVDGVETANRVTVRASRLDDVGETVQLARLRPGERWLLPLTTLPPGAWLVTARDIGGEVARPALHIQGAMPGVGTAPDPLRAAAAERNSGERVAAYRAALAQLAQNLSHPPDAQATASLAFVRHHIELLTLTHASGLDLVRGLAAAPGLAARLLVESAMSPAAFERLWSALSDLPFLWQTVPLKDWYAALDDLVSVCEGLPDAIARKLQADAHATLSARFPAFEVILEGWKRNHDVTQPNAIVFGQQRAANFRRGQEIRDKLRSAVAALLLRHLPDGRGVTWPALPNNLPLGEIAAVNIPLQISPNYQHYCAPVLSAPWLAATCATTGHALTPEQIQEVRRLRDFDPEWFDQALSIALAQHVYNLPREIP